MNELYLREATEEDIDLLYIWVNDPIVRKNSFISEYISYETHKEWFRRILTDESILQYILMNDGIPIGQIRLTIRGNDAELGYSIAPEYRGMGYGRQLMVLTINEIRSKKSWIKKLVARVKPGNEASSKLLKATGYTSEYIQYVYYTQEHNNVDYIYTSEEGESMENNEFSLVDSFAAVIEAGAPIADTAIDWLRNDDGLRNIPFISQAVSLFRICDTIHERHNVKKIATFIQTVAEGSCDKEKREKYLVAWHGDKKKRYEELEYLIVIIDRYFQEDMSRMLARVYLAFLEGKFVWQDVLGYAAVIERLLPGDFESLNNEIDGNKATDSTLRLVGLGMMTSRITDITEIKDGTLSVGDPNKIKYEITEFGRMFLEAIK